MLEAEYVLPLRHDVHEDLSELTAYLSRLSTLLPVTVVDGSPKPVFDRHAAAWGSFLRHVPVSGWTANGKVAGVVTGVYLARSDVVVIADDDVRYDEAGLREVVSQLDGADLVRPQNYFPTMPWHARWDTARTLLNRAFDADYPGTLVLRRSAFVDMGGYCGAVLFENLELIRTLRAFGGREVKAVDLYVPRLPPTPRHFLGQRVRQAYDSHAQPLRMIVELALLPALLLSARRSPRLLAWFSGAGIALAERGRRRGGGSRVFPRFAALWTPLWLAERAVCIWLAVALRVRGGVGYRGSPLSRAAHSIRSLSRGRSGSRPCGGGISCLCELPPAPVRGGGQLR
jgi:Glycosyl transferase family 21